MKNIKKYEDFTKVNSNYNNLLNKRLNSWMVIEKDRKIIGNTYNIIKNCLNATTEEYHYTYLGDCIECEANLYFSGCGDETEYFDIPLEIILLDEKDWNEYLENLKDDIIKQNLETEEQLNILKAEQEKAKEEKERLIRLEKYEKLKREFDSHE